MARSWMPNVSPPQDQAHSPLVQGSTGGWQPLSTYTGYQNNARRNNQNRLQSLSNMPQRPMPVMGANRGIYNQDWSLKSGTSNNNNGSPFGTQVSSSVTTGGLSPAPTSAAFGQLGFSQAPGVPIAGDAVGELAGQFSGASSAARSGANTELARRAAHEGGVLDLAQQRARADESIQMGDLYRKLQELQQGQQQFATSSLFDLLAGMGR